MQGKSTVLFALLSLLLSIAILGNAAGCSYTKSPHQEVDQGDIAYYSLKVRNTQQPLGVDVRIEINQSHSSYNVENSEFHLKYQESTYVYIYVITDLPEIDYLTTHYIAHEKNVPEPSYHKETNGDFKTTIIHPPPPNRDYHGPSEDNIFLGILGHPLSESQYYGLSAPGF